MAQYEESASKVLDDIGSSGLSESTKAAIGNILAPTGSENVKVEKYEGGIVSEGTQLVQVDKSTQLTTDPGAPVIVMDSDAPGANVTFAANSKVEAIVLSGGANKVVFEGDKGVRVETGGGNDSVSTGAGDDTLVLKGGDVTVNTGDGNDAVVLQGGGAAHITGGKGDMVVTLQTGTGTATIDAGDGFDQLFVGEDRTVHNFEYDPASGTFVMHSSNPITMSGVQVVTFDKDGDHKITGKDNITILAENAQDSLVAKLYKVALGREAIDGEDGWGNSTLGGINWWMNEFEKGETDGTVDHLVRSFLNCEEFHNKYDGMTNADYVNALFTNLGKQDAALAQRYLDNLDTGGMTREQVAQNLAESAMTVEALGIDGANYVIDGF